MVFGLMAFGLKACEAMQVPLAAPFVASLHVHLEIILHRVKNQGEQRACQHLDEGNIGAVVVVDEVAEPVAQVDERHDHRKRGEGFLQDLVMVRVAGQEEEAEDKEHLEDEEPPGVRTRPGVMMNS